VSSVSNLTEQEIENMSTAELAFAIGCWHEERNLIDGSTDEAQFTKGFEEFVEVYMALHPGTSPIDCVTDLTMMLLKMLNKGRIKTDPDGSTLADSIGDVNVVLINHAVRNNLTLAQCLRNALLDIKDRKGKMIDGVFVKEADL
tara:strand:- start:23217 stop:23648 length:432 start_codon:yes stop_codon:yes gene_type:complete